MQNFRKNNRFLAIEKIFFEFFQKNLVRIGKKSAFFVIKLVKGKNGAVTGLGLVKENFGTKVLLLNITKCNKYYTSSVLGKVFGTLMSQSIRILFIVSSQGAKKL